MRALKYHFLTIGKFCIVTNLIKMNVRVSFQYILTNCEKIPFDSEKEIRLLFLHSLQKSERFGAAYFKVLVRFSTCIK